MPENTIHFRNTVKSAPSQFHWCRRDNGWQALVSLCLPLFSSLTMASALPERREVTLEPCQAQSPSAEGWSSRLPRLGRCSAHTPDPKAGLCWAFLKSSWRSVGLIHSWACRCHSRDVLAGRSRELFVSSACCLSRELPFLSAEPPRWPGTMGCLKPWPGGGSGGGGRSKKRE